MFNVVLVMIFLSGDAPIPIALFQQEAHCNSIAGMLNQGFKQTNKPVHLVCINAVEHGDI